jgi:hypothetical protein
MRVFYTKRMRWAREGFKGFGSLTVDSEGWFWWSLGLKRARVLQVPMCLGIGTFIEIQAKNKTDLWLECLFLWNSRVKEGGWKKKDKEGKGRKKRTDRSECFLLPSSANLRLREVRSRHLF